MTFIEELNKAIDEIRYGSAGKIDWLLPKSIGKEMAYTGPWSSPQEYQHEMAEYHGFTESYRYCKKCNQKESK